MQHSPRQAIDGWVVASPWSLGSEAVEVLYMRRGSTPLSPFRSSVGCHPDFPSMELSLPTGEASLAWKHDLKSFHGPRKSFHRCCQSPKDLALIGTLFLTIPPSPPRPRRGKEDQRLLVWESTSPILKCGSGPGKRQLHHLRWLRKSGSCECEDPSSLQVGPCQLSRHARVYRHPQATYFY